MALEPAKRQPDFENLASVLERKAPKRPTLFEYFLNERLYTRLSGLAPSSGAGDYQTSIRFMKAFAAAGYDYVTLSCPWVFPGTAPDVQLASRSLNHAPVIFDQASFDRYPWPDPDDYDYGYIDRVADELPGNMGIVMGAAEGILENVVALVGYDNLCLMLYDDPQLAEDIFARTGEVILGFYKQALRRGGVRAIMCNDDWGFQSQTLIAPAQLRELVFPWYKQYCDLAHQGGRYTILHSCGAYRAITDDIVAMGFDARHSYEDKIVPVEQAYEELKGKIAVLGGIDVDFLCRRPIEDIEKRARALLAQTGGVGYALGSGNSIPEYVPDDAYLAMRNVAFEE